MDRMQAIQELARRGKLPADLQPMYDEAVKRGLIGGEEPSKSDRTFSNLNASASGFAEGIPIVGPAFNKGLNMAEAGLRTLSGPESYDEEYKKVTEQEAADREANPGTTIAGNVAGGVVGTAPLAAAAPAAFGISKAPLVTRALASGLTGGGIGGADSAVRSDGNPTEILKGTGIGFAAGSLSPLITTGLGQAGRALFPGSKDMLSAIPSRAQRFLERTLGDPAKLARDTAELQKLGPEAMPADVSPLMRQLARGAGSRPEMTDEIVQALEARQAGAATRLRADMDTSFGPRVVPSQVEEGLSAARKAVGPEYEAAFAGSKAVDTKSIADRLDTLAVDKRGAAQSAAQDLRGMLNIKGEDVLDPNPRTLHSVREAIDGLLRTEKNSDVLGILKETRKAVDAELAAKVPNIKVADAKFAELHRQSDALKLGQKLFGNGPEAIRPEEVVSIRSKMSDPAKTALNQGARAEMDRITGTKANDALALKSMIQGEGDWNRLKLTEMFGPDNASKGLGAVDREVRFSNTANRVTGGSDTAASKQVNKLFDDIETPAKTPGDLSVLGLLAKGGRRVIDALFEGNAEATGRKFAEDLGRLSIAKGAQRDALYKALQERATRVPDPKIRAALNALLSSGVSSAAGP